MLVQVICRYIYIPPGELWHKDSEPAAPSAEAQGVMHSLSFTGAELGALRLQLGNKLCKVSNQHSWEREVILKPHFTFQAKMSTGIIKDTLKAALYCTNCCRSKGITVLAEIRHINTGDTLLALISLLHIYQLHKVPHLCPQTIRDTPTLPLRTNIQHICN